MSFNVSSHNKESVSDIHLFTNLNCPLHDSHFSLYSRGPFEQAYIVYHVLGKGGSGVVHAGIRKNDGLPVAIKHISKQKIKDWMKLNGQIMPMEVHMMSIVSGCTGII